MGHRVAPSWRPGWSTDLKHEHDHRHRLHQTDGLSTPSAVTEAAAGLDRRGAYGRWCRGPPPRLRSALPPALWKPSEFAFYPSRTGTFVYRHRSRVALHEVSRLNVRRIDDYNDADADDLAPSETLAKVKTVGEKLGESPWKCWRRLKRGTVHSDVVNDVIAGATPR